MALMDPTTAPGALEECLDEIDDFVMTLDRYPPNIIAVAMSVHLQSLLRTLMECDLCTREQALELVQELERDVFDGAPESTAAPTG